MESSQTEWEEEMHRLQGDYLAVKESLESLSAEHLKQVDALNVGCNGWIILHMKWSISCTYTVDVYYYL